MASRRLRKKRVDPVVKLARTILPEEQSSKGDLAIRDVANHSEADQRATVRSKERETVRRLTRVELLHKARIIDADQMAACEFYLNAYELGYQTIGCTANYMGAGGGGFGSSDLLARYKAQSEARENFQYAKHAIPGHLRNTFDRIVIGPMDIRTITNQQRLEFSLAAFLLHGQIGHMLLVAA
jgi:hypothetical protein